MNRNFQNPGAVLRRADGVLSAAVGDEIVMMDVGQGKYFNLNEIGARIWALLAQPATIDQLVELLAAEYDLDNGVARQDTADFITAMCERGLIVEAGAPD